jgi:integrase
MSNDLLPALRPDRVAWNKGRIIGQKRPLLPRHVWSIRVRLEMAGNARDLALFNLAVDSKLRGCDLVGIRVTDVFAAGHAKERASIVQSKTGKPVRFEITETTRLSLERWISDPEMFGLEFLWPSRLHGSPHLSTRQYARIVRGWVTSLGLEPSAHMAHIPCAGPKWRRSTRRQGTCVRSNCYWGIRRWTALCATLALILRTP